MSNEESALISNNETSNEKITFVHVEPSTLVVDRNVVSDGRLDQEFLIDVGVPAPIMAVRTGSGELRVCYGHRTLAAVHHGHAYVPVLVVPQLLLRAEHPLRVAIEQGAVAALQLFGSALELDGATPDRRAQVMALAVIVAAYETDTGPCSWRSPDPATATSLTDAEVDGHELNDVRRLASRDGDR